MKRDPNNPILTRADLPGDMTSVFNPGAIWHEHRIKLMLRVQNRGRETLLYMAESKDGINFDIDDAPIEFDLDYAYHVYDPRLTEIDGVGYAVLAVDTDDGCRLATARTDDWRDFELVGVSLPDVRNGVLFPEKIGGRFMRLERPNNVEGTGDEIWLSESDDLVAWRRVAPVMKGRLRYWDEMVGPGPPPVRTDAGWLLVYHGIARHFTPIYQAGVVLLDLDDPSRVIGRSRHNVLEPRELYETVGQVPNVVFPSGMVVQNDDVMLYYGAADTSIGLAHTTIWELLDSCD